MENKKQLIIIPPMSEAVKKLHEVLEGIAADENMEITLIDDLKELNQFVNSTGQCLILASNAKKCATFLQENRFFLIKNHCKTILFTPKEIPAKTLVKFTKIGLTESILENSPPKTFLYKVKLLLRSIKTAKPQEDTEKTVKSLEQKTKEEVELELKEKNITTEKNTAAPERAVKKEQVDGETIDYGNPLKGKIKPADENLDTHWKSDRKKSAAELFSEEENSMPPESELSAIDMYYRGKNKKQTQLDAQEDDFDKKMAELLALEEENKKKKNSYADVLDEGTMKQKRLDNPIESEENSNKKAAQVDLEISPARTKSKLRDPEPEEMDDFDKKMAELMAAEEERKKKAYQEEDLGGVLKGKVSIEKTVEQKDEQEENNIYDNSELELEAKSKSVELDLLAAEKKRDKKNIEENAEEELHEGEVDHINGNMIGDEGTVDKIRTRMEGRSKYEEADIEEEDALDLHSRKNKQPEEEEEEKSKSSLDLESKEQNEGEKRKALRHDKEEKDLREKSVELTLAPGAKKSLDKQENEEKSEIHKKGPGPTQEEAERDKKALDKTSEDERKKRESDSEKIQEKNSGKNVHLSTVDKIDTFYRGGEAAKKKEQDWSNLIDKNDTFDLLPEKGKRNDGVVSAAKKTDLGEQTIDYRKMKEEFEMINHGASASEAAGGQTGNMTLQNNEDAGSFKVQEIDPKSLDFSINIINSIYQKDIKAKQIFAMLADELINNYHCYPIFYTYKLSEKKFTEVFNPFVEIKDNRMNEENKSFWNEFKKDTALFEKFQEKSMTTWRCPEIVSNNEVWEDVELPSWAENELKSKKVELIFPYFDGIDRMGMAVVLFPEGLDPKAANGLLTVLEMARSLFLDTIQRYQVQPVRIDLKDQNSEAPIEEKKNILSFFGGLFGKKKAG